MKEVDIGSVVKNPVNLEVLPDLQGPAKPGEETRCLQYKSGILYATRVTKEVFIEFCSMSLEDQNYYNC